MMLLKVMKLLFSHYVMVKNYQVREGRESFSVTINDTDTPPIVTLTSSFSHTIERI